MVARFDPWHGFEGSVLPTDVGGGSMWHCRCFCKSELKTGFEYHFSP